MADVSKRGPCKPHLRLLSALWAVVSTLSVNSPAADAVSDFKRIVSQNHKQYELLYSVTQRKTKALEAAIAKHNQEGRGILRINFDQEDFMYTKNLGSSAIVRTASHERSLQTLDLSETQTAWGVASGRFWSVSQAQLILDDTKSKGDVDAILRDAHAFAGHFLLLGLRVEPGSIRWDGNSFNASMPSEYGGASISGTLQIRDGFPWQIEHGYGPGRRIRVSYEYKLNDETKALVIPTRFTISEIDAHGEEVSSWLVKLFRFNITNVNNSMITPEKLIAANSKHITVLRKTKAGLPPILTSYHGQVVAPEGRHIFIWRRWLLIWVVSIPLLTLYFALRNKEKRDSTKDRR